MRPLCSAGDVILQVKNPSGFFFFFFFFFSLEGVGGEG